MARTIAQPRMSCCRSLSLLPAAVQGDLVRVEVASVNLAITKLQTSSPAHKLGISRRLQRCKTPGPLARWKADNYSEQESAAATL